MAMELILLESLQDLGEIGDTVKVSNGYARNYLIPKGLASKVTPGVLRQLEAKKRVRQQEYADEVSRCTGIAEKISDQSITIPMQTAEDEKLYGSVKSQQIVEALKEMDVDVDRKQIVLREPIRELGVYSVDIHLHREVIATIKVWVVKA